MPKRVADQQHVDAGERQQLGIRSIVTGEHGSVSRRLRTLFKEVILTAMVHFTIICAKVDV
jgi:hypothetical protein